MVKPPPSRTRAKPPVSLPSVNALSSAPADTKAPPLAPAAAKPVPAPAQPAPAQPAAAQPAATPSPARPAPVAVKVAVPVAAGAVAKNASPAPAAPAAIPAKPPKKTVSVKLRIEKPVAKVVAPKKPAEPAPVAKRAEPAPAPSRPVAVTSAAAMPVAAAPVAAKPVAVEQPKPAVKAETSSKVEAVAVPPSPAPKPAEAGPAAPALPKEPPKPASLDTLPLPRPPEFATVTTETVMSQALTMARAFGALQAKMLEHACAEFKATLGEAETLARSGSASEAITLQAKAVRRSYESYAEHLKELARIANTALRKGG